LETFDFDGEKLMINPTAVMGGFCYASCKIQVIELRELRKRNMLHKSGSATLTDKAYAIVKNLLAQVPNTWEIDLFVDMHKLTDGDVTNFVGAVDDYLRIFRVT